MSYPNYFTPRDWRALPGDPETFLARIAEGTRTQTPEVQSQWQDIGLKLIEVIDLFQEMVHSDVGDTHVLLQANPELDEHKMMLNFRVNQRAWGADGPGISVNNWSAIATKLNEATSMFSVMVATDRGDVKIEMATDALAPHNIMVKYTIVQTNATPPTPRPEIHHKTRFARPSRVRGLPNESR